MASSSSSSTAAVLPSPDEKLCEAWAQSLIGRDWEIYWVDDEDSEDVDPVVEVNPQDNRSIDTTKKTSTAPPTTASGQQTAERQKINLGEMTNGTTTSLVAAGVSVMEARSTNEISLAAPPNAMAPQDDHRHVGIVESTIAVVEAGNDGGDSGNNEDGDEKASVVDDWYDGHVLRMERTTPKQERNTKSTFVFDVLFVGDETVYKVCLVPSKVRPSARGWVQRTLALLRPPHPAGECDPQENHDPFSWESNLPPDTSTLEDKTMLRDLQKRILSTSKKEPSRLESICSNDTDVDRLTLPGPIEYERMERLKYLLESQIFLRSKLAKIERHDGKDRFTDGVRNPTEPYVNYLLQCCSDLVQSCDWYCKTWTMLHYFAGNGRDEVERKYDDITLDGLIREYLDFGRDTIVNVAMIDVNSCSSAKRRQTTALTNGSTGRRTKRRRLQYLRAGTAPPASLDDDREDGIISAATKLEMDMVSTEFADDFVRAAGRASKCWYMITFGEIFRCVSHLVIFPLAKWKMRAGLILRDSTTELIHLSQNQDESVKKQKREKRSNDDYRPNNKMHPSNPRKSAKHDPSSESSGDEEEEVRFTYEDVQECVTAIRNNRVLSRFNLFNDIHRLHTLLHDIEQVENKARTLLRRLAEVPRHLDKDQDTIVRELKDILKETNSPSSAIYNISPLCKQSSGNSIAINREDIGAAIELRGWFVDISRMKTRRERQSFVDNMYSMIEQDCLPDHKRVPCLASYPDIAVFHESGVQVIKDLFESAKVNKMHIDEYKRNLLDSPLRDCDIIDLKKQYDELRASLATLAKLPAISSVEEKIACRLDLVKWVHDASMALAKLDTPGEKISFEEIESHYQSLDALLRGRGPCRRQLVEGTAGNDKMDNEVHAFVMADANGMCKPAMDTVREIYTHSLSWKDRAESIVSCLRCHGNAAAGPAAGATKTIAMVDIKRVDDLIKEYGESPVSVNGFINHLTTIRSVSHMWAQSLRQTLLSQNLKFSELLAFVEKEREMRPKGLIMHPTRAMVDSMVDLLLWYQNVVDAFRDLQQKLESLSENNNAAMVMQYFSSSIRRKVYPLLADGTELLDQWGLENKKSGSGAESFKVEQELSLQILESMYGIKRTPRWISKEKLQSNDLIESILKRMIRQDEQEGHPLRLMVWFQWHLHVSEFVAHFDSTGRKGLAWKEFPTLDGARELLSKQPFVAEKVDFGGCKSVDAFLHAKTNELAELERIIHEAETIERAINDSFSDAKELLRGSYQKSDAIKSHMSQLKEYLELIKARSQGQGGLALNEVLESQLDHQIKLFGWLLKTFSYPVLHEGKPSFLSGERSTNGEANRIAWDALVSLYERIPKDVDGSGDFALLVLRVTELYNAASNWNNEITQSTLLSNRGNKRRNKVHVVTPSVENLETIVDNSGDADNSTKIQMAQMEQLAKDPTLNVVEMPRHNALDMMIQNSQQFEVQLQNFLRQDYQSPYHDKAPFPKTNSLVGSNGQFILYRLTLDPLFGKMKSSMQSLSCIGEKVFAETRGKATFDWMLSAVAWIERLHYSVAPDTRLTSKSEKYLVIKKQDARDLCSLGEETFLQTTEDMRQTLSTHGIFVSTSAQKKKLTVTLKKDGAHHSVGGTVIRWCPILFDALRADLSRTEKWEDTAKSISSSFQKYCTLGGLDGSRDDSSLFLLYEFAEKVRKVVVEGHRVLVVLPNKELYEAMTDCLQQLQAMLDRKVTQEMKERFSKQIYTNSSSLFDSRFFVLDTLLYRRAVSGASNDFDVKKDDFEIGTVESSFRYTCRISLERAFSSVMELLGFDLNNDCDCTHLCVLKAWEIECEMNDRFQVEIGASRVSDEYRDKARSLKTNLTTKNMTLCLRVLTGEIDAASLVKMTSDQLASEEAKLDREKALQDALRDTVLTRAINEPIVVDIRYQRTDTTNHDASTFDAKKPSNSIRKVQAKGENVEARDLSENTPKSLVDTTVTTPSYPGSNGGDGALTIERRSPGDVDIPTLEEDKSEATLTATDDRVEKMQLGLCQVVDRRHVSRPPPPPSLATRNVFHSMLINEETSRKSSRGVRVRAVNGDDKFRIEFQGSTNLAFTAALYQEDEMFEKLNQVMPDTLIQQGRSKIEDLKRFLTDKLKGGKWKATCLRLTTISDTDTSEYKSYYKEYEFKERIAMFKLCGEQGNKMFLVTPRFHEPISRTGLVSFPVKTSTYALILMKEENPPCLTEQWKQSSNKMLDHGDTSDSSNRDHYSKAGGGQATRNFSN